MVVQGTYGDVDDGVPGLCGVGLGVAGLAVGADDGLGERVCGGGGGGRHDGGRRVVQVRVHRRRVLQRRQQRLRALRRRQAGR